jgi:hypothetical protein
VTRWSLPPDLPRAARIEVSVSYRVPVVSLAFLGPLRSFVTVNAAHVSVVDRYRSRE